MVCHWYRTAQGTYLLLCVSRLRWAVGTAHRALTPFTLTIPAKILTLIITCRFEKLYGLAHSQNTGSQYPRIKSGFAGMCGLRDALKLTVNKRSRDVFARHGIAADFDNRFVAEGQPAARPEPRPIKVHDCYILAGRAGVDRVSLRLKLQDEFERV